MATVRTNAYGLEVLPEWRKNEASMPERPMWPEGPAKWSGKAAPPAIGERLQLAVNNFGAATVVSYFVEHGYLGVEVELEVVPGWLREQCERARIAPRPKVFGAEIGGGE